MVDCSTCTCEGFISMDEFEEACCLLGKHTASVIPREHVLAMARNMDLNKDGHTQYLQTTRRTYISTDLSRLHSFFTSTFLQTTRRATKWTRTSINIYSEEHSVNKILLNKDGQIDFNEFLETFRIVDQFGRDLVARRASEDSSLPGSDDT